MKGSIKNQIMRIAEESGINESTEDRQTMTRNEWKNHVCEQHPDIKKNDSASIAEYTPITSKSYMNQTYSTWQRACNYMKGLDGDLKLKNMEQLKPAQLESLLTFWNETLKPQDVRVYSAHMQKFITACELKFDKNLSELRLPIKEGSKEAKDALHQVAPRNFLNPEAVVQNIINRDGDKADYNLGARIMMESGTRHSGTSLIREYQLKGIVNTPWGERLGSIIVKEKGGKERLVYMTIPTYRDLEKHIKENGNFKFDQDTMLKKINEASLKASDLEGCAHSLRHNFAQKLYDKLIAKGMKELVVKKIISVALGHCRPGICSIYLNRRYA